MVSDIPEVIVVSRRAGMSAGGLEIIHSDGCVNREEFACAGRTGNRRPIAKDKRPYYRKFGKGKYSW